MRKGYLLFFSLFTASVFGSVLSVDDPFSLIDTAKQHAQTNLSNPVFLSVHIFRQAPISDSCNKRAWEYIFTDHTDKKTGFVRFYEKMVDQVCVLESQTEITSRYPWVGVREMESILPMKKYSFSDAMAKVTEGITEEVNFERIEIYRPNHPAYTQSIYGNFVFYIGTERKQWFFNFMTGVLE